jgi:hypothetical protein
MHLPQPNQSTDFLPPPPGTHVAVCYRFIDLGTQETEFQGQKKHQRKVMLGWELNEMMEDGKPFMVSQRYTWSMSEKANLRADLESWRGVAFKESDFGPGGFDIRRVIGAPCMLTIVHAEKNGKTYANIRAIGKLPKGMDVPKAVNPHVYFSLDEFDQSVFDNLSAGLKAVIIKSPEYQKIVNGGHESQDNRQIGGGDPDLDDSIPF